jgi:hypothetical protein
VKNRDFGGRNPERRILKVVVGDGFEPSIRQPPKNMPFYWVFERLKRV